MTDTQDCGCGKPVDPEQTDVVKMSCCPPVAANGPARKGFSAVRVFAWAITLAGLGVLAYALAR